MSVTSLYPVLMSADVAATSDFYRRVLRFEPTYESDWYVSLRLGESELAIVAYDHPTVPETHRHLPRGLLVNLEVDDVDAVYSRIAEAGDATFALDLRDEEFGQRHFIIEAPDGVLVDVITPTAPSAAYADAYVS